MKIIINQQNLKKALGLTEKVITKNTSLPILNNILLKTDGGVLKITATNLEIAISVVIGVKIIEVGEITVPARIFTDFINNTNDEKITLTTRNNTLYIQTEQYKTQILGLNPKDFPIIPKIKTSSVGVIPIKDFKRALIATIDSVSLSDTRPELTGIYTQIKQNSVTFASTDSFRLTEVTVPAKASESINIIIPHNTAAELIRICSEFSGDFNIKISDNQISFYNNDIDLISRLIDGNYPPYKNVIPEKALGNVLVKKDDLEKNIRLAGLFSPGNSDVKLAGLPESLNISARNPDKGEIETIVPALLKGEQFQISLNYRYVLDGLKNIINSDVVLGFTGEGSPFVIKPSIDKDMVYLVMPLRN